GPRPSPAACTAASAANAASATTRSSTPVSPIPRSTPTGGTSMPSHEGPHCRLAGSALGGLRRSFVTRGRTIRWLPTLVALAVLAAGAAAQSPSPDLDDVLGQVGSRIAEYFTRAQRLVFVEKTTIYEMSSTMTPEGFARVLESDLRVEWDPT